MTSSNLTLKTSWAALCVIAVLIGAFFLFRERSLNALGFALLLACPLMHLFMHRSRSHTEHSDHSATDEKQ